MGEGGDTENGGYRGYDVSRALIADNLAADRWVVDNPPSADFPISTRGNIGEVFPDVVKPFSWSLWGIPYSELGWRQALVDVGAFDLDEFPDDAMAMLGVHGGYGYLNVSASRIFGVRTPGLTPEAIDYSFFGEQANAPPYTPGPKDVSSKHEAKLGETLRWILTTESLPELDEMQEKALGLRAARPEFGDISDADLLQRTRDIARDWWAPYWRRHIAATYHSMIPAGAVQTICAAVGAPELAADILTSDLPVDSAKPAKALWKLSRTVRGSEDLSRIFDDGLDDVMKRLAASSHPDAKAFLKAWKTFLFDYGFRGPNEWEMASRVWEIDAKAPLAALGSQRRTDDDASPSAKKAERDRVRKNAIAEIESRLAGDPDTLAQFQMAAQACAVFFAGRERTRANSAIITHEMRMPMYALGQRFVERSVFEHANDFSYFVNDEWDTLLQDASSAGAILHARRAEEARLAGLVPQFIVNDKRPDTSTWARRGEARKGLVVGDSLSGQPGCAGLVRGTARVVLDPSDPGDLEPGDILIAQHTDPSWTPIFAAVSGVVVNVGAAISHAVIVARELGVPCVVSAEGATDRIPSGATIEVDGGAGTVTVISLPEAA